MSTVAALAPNVHRINSTIPIMSVPQTARQAVAPIKTSCSVCHLRELCLPCGMSNNDVERLDGLLFGRRRILAGQPLYREGDKFQFIYAVRAGTLKSSLMLADGREQVSGFHIAGELVGLDGAAQGHHASATMALEDTDICAIPYTHLTDMAASNGSM
jgi:CRP/FNR family transcriptional regulator, anaerobic regulatory protein